MWLIFAVLFSCFSVISLKAAMQHDQLFPISFLHFAYFQIFQFCKEEIYGGMVVSKSVKHINSWVTIFFFPLNGSFPDSVTS